MEPFLSSTSRSLRRLPRHTPHFQPLAAPKSQFPRRTYSNNSSLKICTTCLSKISPSTQYSAHRPSSSFRRLASTTASPTPRQPSRKKTTSSPPPTEPQEQQAAAAAAASAQPTYYALFPATLPSGPPPSGPFAIDLRSLRREYLTLQATAHPDRHAQSASSSAMSTTINTAYRTLLDPLLRAEYILSLRGLETKEGEGSREGEGEKEFLMEVLEAREEVEEVGMEMDGEGEMDDAWEGLRMRNEERMRACEEVIAECFSRGDWEGGRREVGRLRYWVGIRDEMRGLGH